MDSRMVKRGNISVVTVTALGGNGGSGKVAAGNPSVEEMGTSLLQRHEQFFGMSAPRCPQTQVLVVSLLAKTHGPTHQLYVAIAIEICHSRYGFGSFK